MKIYRIFEFFFVINILIILAPLFFIISILIILDSKGPILFISERVGKDNNIFLMPKFRSMHQKTKLKSTSAFNDYSNITRVGKYIRRYNLDELPQLFLILNNKMSLVGPRPSLKSQIKLNNLRKKYKISTLLPGITGLAQINGRDKLSINQKISYEKIYLSKRSFFFNLKIICLTLLRIIQNHENIKKY